jgi:sulfur-oxidizing protein SoxX
LISLAFSAALLAHPAAGAEHVVAYRVVDARAIPDSLTGRQGDAQAGRALYLDDKLARCAGCHGVPDGRAGAAAADSVLAPATAAPPLGDVGRRLDPGAIRLWLVAPQLVSADTEMPGFYSIGQRMDPADPRFGEPLLTAAQIEDLVAYLAAQSGAPAAPAQ